MSGQVSRGSAGDYQADERAKNFLQFVVIHTVKGFNVVNEADVFLEFFCFFCDPADAGNLSFGSSAFSKSRFHNIL